MSWLVRLFRGWTWDEEVVRRSVERAEAVEKTVRESDAATLAALALYREAHSYHVEQK